MEELGIGRPSTYAATLSVLRDRGYVRLEKRSSSPRTRAASSPPSSRASSSAMSSTTSPPTSRRSSTRSRPASSPGRKCCATSGRFSADVDEIKDLRVSEVLDALNELLGAAHLPGQGRRRRPAPVPDLRHRQAVAEARQVRRLHRLLELSRVPLHPPARRRRRERRRRRAGGDGTRPRRRSETGLDVTLRTGRFGPYVQLGEADGKARSRSAPACPRAGTPATIDLERRWSFSRCRARSASIPRPASRSPPASAATGRSSCMTAPTPISTRSRKCSPSASTAPSRCSPRSRPAAAAAAAARAPKALKDLGEHPTTAARSPSAPAATAPT